MLIYDVFTALCFALFTAEVLFVAVNIFVKKRPERIAYVRGFKKGKCLVIYFTALPLYFMGYIYAGADFANALIGTIGEASKLVVLNYSLEPIQALAAANPFFKVTVYYCFVLVAVNAVMFAMSLFGQRMWLWSRSVGLRHTKKDKLYVLGCNSNSINVCRSDKNSFGVIAGNVSKRRAESLYADKIFYISCLYYEPLLERIFKDVARDISRFEKRSRRSAEKAEAGKEKTPRKYTVIINTENDDAAISLCNFIIDKIQQTTKPQEGAKRTPTKEEIYDRLCVCVFGDPQYADIYGDVAERSEGCIRYVNKYRKVAIAFVDSHPFTEFMSDKQIDYATAFVKEGVDVNVCMLGFGKTNQQIFLTSVANNQFVCKDANNKVRLKAVKYHIFDKEPTQNHKNLNHNYYRFRNECDENISDYLPMPELPAEESYKQLDLNDKDFYNSLRKVVQRNADDVNIVIIAFGSDLENIDMAHKLIAKRREWGIKNLVIFVRVTDFRKEEHILDAEDCYVFGNEKNDVYNVDAILRDRIFSMAYMRDELYCLEWAIKHGSKYSSELKRSVHNAEKREWYRGKNGIERDSNLYCCLSLRSKLNMMGLDYCAQSEPNKRALSEEEYFAKYDVGKEIKYLDEEKDELGFREVKYTLDFPDSLRRNLAVQEHYRWNSFMISQGMIPADRQTILNEKTVGKDGKEKYTNGKNYRLRRHGNLTTMDGLEEFRRIVAKRDNVDEEQKDVIKYDYQLMDEAYWMLTNNGYKIVEKQSLAEK